VSLLKTRKKPKVKKSQKTNIFEIVSKAGLSLIALALLFALIIYFPIISKEVGYSIRKPSPYVKVVASKNIVDVMKSGDEVVAVDPDFSVIVPKISVNSKIVGDVDPYDSQIYQRELTKGVAHAKGTVYPGQPGNSFYFAHSSNNFFNANLYNSVFYLLNKMVAGDYFYLAYKGDIYKYKVTEVKVVQPEAVNYLTEVINKKMATLMTCWPAGTDLQRLVVVGELE
jgi:LPXTG-site transpeptidase (sortase) family protein